MESTVGKREAHKDIKERVSNLDIIANGNVPIINPTGYRRNNFCVFKKPL